MPPAAMLRKSRAGRSLAAALVLGILAVLAPAPASGGDELSPAPDPLGPGSERSESEAKGEGDAQNEAEADASDGEGIAPADAAGEPLSKPARKRKARSDGDDDRRRAKPRTDKKKPSKKKFDKKKKADKEPEKKRKKRRGDVHPCMTPDPGFGIYDRWSTAPSLGQMITPHKGGIRKDGSFDLVVHFHGHEPVRKEFVKRAKGSVLVGIDLGIGSGAYGQAFSAPHVWKKLVESVEKAVAKKAGRKKARVRKLALSAWSAGYGAIEQILRQTGGRGIDAVVLLDSLHAGYVDERGKTLKVAQLDPFVSFARKAAAGQKLMFLSHSSIIPPGYASTHEVADFLVERLGGRPRKASRNDVLGLEMFQRYDRGNFHVRGYDGNDKPDHCAHIGLMADVVKVHLERRWKTPRGRR